MRTGSRVLLSRGFDRSASDFVVLGDLALGSRLKRFIEELDIFENSLAALSIL